MNCLEVGRVDWEQEVQLGAGRLIGCQWRGAPKRCETEAMELVYLPSGATLA